MRSVKCDYCNTASRLVKGDEIYPHREDLYHFNFWLCDRCKAYVGCHRNGDGTKPLGRLANAELRLAKRKAHMAFDPLWKEGRMTRPEAYKWLADKLGINRRNCHIGMFEVGLCLLTVKVCLSYADS